MSRLRCQSKDHGGDFGNEEPNKPLKKDAPKSARLIAAALVAMRPNTSRLVEVLSNIVALLQSDSEQHWSSYIDDCRRRLLASDYSGIEKLLSSYGGMGSFNDLVIGQSEVNGKFSWKPQAQQNNDRLSELRTKAFELARGISQNHA